MPTRSVTVVFQNKTSSTLTLTAASTKGEWVTPPPTNIGPSVTDQITPHHWESDTPAGGNNASGTVTYQMSDTDAPVTLVWNSVEGKTNSYSATAPSGYTVILPSGSGIDGPVVTVTYTLQPS